MEKETKHPDFNEWLKTPDGLSSNDINTLAEQKYLTNRLWVDEISSDIDNASGYKKLLLTNSKSLLNRIKK